VPARVGRSLTSTSGQPGNGHLTTSSSRRSPVTLSPGFTSGDYDTNLVTASLGMLEIGARQLNDWRLHDPPTSFPSASQVSRSTRLCYSLLPRHLFRLPGRYTSPPVLSEDLSSKKTKVSHHCRPTWRWRGIPNVCTFCFPDAPQNPSPPSLDTWLYQRSSSTAVCASRNIQKTLKPFHLHCFIISLHFQTL